MALLPDPATAVLDPFRKHKTLNINFFVHDPITGEPYSRDPRNIARKAEEYIAASGVADTVLLRRPRPSSTSSTRSASGPTRTQRFHHIDSVEGWWNTGRDEPGGNLGYKVSYKGGYFPVPPVDHYADLRDDIVTNMIGDAASRSSGRTTRWAPRARRRSTTSSTRCCTPRDELMLFKYIVKNTAWHARQDRHLHAQAAVRRQRLRHARPPVAVEGRPAAVPRRVRLRRSLGHGPLLRRRPAPPRAEPAGVHQPDGELLPPPGAGLRGAGQPGLLGAQPLGLHPHPALGQQPQGQAHRVPLPRLLGQPVPGVLGADDGGHGRHQEQDRAARPDRQGPLRAAAGRGQGHRAGARQPAAR